MARIPGLGDDAGLYTYFAGDFELGALFAHHGAPQQVRYADFGLWRDASLPETTDCPPIANSLACSGKCGACLEGMFCHGRSPLHPTGVCIPRDFETCSGSKPCRLVGQSCFVYRVEPEAQREADLNGICFPVEDCRALAERLPGGGRCDEPVAAADGG